MCLFVHHNREPCKSGSTDRDAICGPTRVRLRDDELDGVRIGTTSEWNYAMTVMWTVATVTLATCFFIPVRNHNSCICILAAAYFPLQSVDGSRSDEACGFGIIFLQYLDT